METRNETSCGTDSNRLVLIGGGGHCRSVLDAALRMKVFDQIVITDNHLAAGTEIMGCRVAGGDDVLPVLYGRGIRKAVITVGSIKSTRLRHELYNMVETAGFDFPNIIDPSAVIAETVKLNRGIFIGKNAVVNTEAAIDDMAIINTCAVVEHGCYIGRFSHIAVGAVVCGEAIIEDDVFIGANATVIQGVKVGKNSVIGAGSIVLKDVPAGTTFKQRTDRRIK